MQRWKTAVPMMLLCLLLSACGGTQDRMQEALQFRTDLLAAQGCSFEAELTAQGETEVFECTLRCSISPDGTARAEVLAPEELAGVTATITDSGMQIDYDGVRVDCGQLSGSVSPIGTPGLLYAAWTGGYIAAAGSEEHQTMARYLLGSGSSEKQISTWFSADGTPESCEAAENGMVVLQCRLRDFTFGDSSSALSSEAANLAQP